MAMYKLCLVLGAYIHAAVSSTQTPIDALKNEIETIQNETQLVEYVNEQLSAEIKIQGEQFAANYSKLKAMEGSLSEELKNLTDHVTHLELKINYLYKEKDYLVNVSIPAEEQVLLWVEYGLKWLKEDLAFFQKRESDGDQAECFHFPSGPITSPLVGFAQQSFVLLTDSYRDEFEYLKLVLSEATANLNKANLTNNQLNVKLNLDKAVFAVTLADVKSFIEDDERNVEKAKALLKKFEEEYTEVSKEVEKLTHKLQDLENKEAELRAEARKVKEALDSYVEARRCYERYEIYATGAPN